MRKQVATIWRAGFETPSMLIEYLATIRFLAANALDRAYHRVARLKAQRALPGHRRLPRS